MAKLHQPAEAEESGHEAAEAQESELANRLNDTNLIVGIRIDPNVNIDGVPDIAKRVDGLAANHQKADIMGGQQPQEFFEIGWYLGRIH